MFQDRAGKIAVGLVDFLEDGHHAPRISLHSGRRIALTPGGLHRGQRLARCEGRRESPPYCGPGRPTSNRRSRYTWRRSTLRGRLLDLDFERPGLAFQRLDVGHREHFDVVVAHALHQLGRNDARGAVARGEGLVQPGHRAADRRTFFDQIDGEPGRREVQRGLDSGHPAAADQHRAVGRLAVAVGRAVGASAIVFAFMRHLALCDVRIVGWANRGTRAVVACRPTNAVSFPTSVRFSLRVACTRRP